jgi:hypothetical protein
MDQVSLPALPFPKLEHRIAPFPDRSKDFALLDNITICVRVVFQVRGPVVIAVSRIGAVIMIKWGAFKSPRVMQPHFLLVGPTRFLENQPTML